MLVKLTKVMLIAWLAGLTVPAHGQDSSWQAVVDAAAQG